MLVLSDVFRLTIVQFVPTTAIDIPLLVVPENRAIWIKSVSAKSTNTQTFDFKVFAREGGSLRQIYKGGLSTNHVGNAYLCDIMLLPFDDSYLNVKVATTGEEVTISLHGFIYDRNN